MKRIILPLLALVAVIAASCSSERESNHLLDAVPSDATSVTFVNLDHLAKDGIDTDELAKGKLPLHTGIRAFVTLADGTSLQISDIPAPDSLAAAGYILDGEAGEPLTAYTRPDGATVITDAKRGVAYYSVFSPSRALEIVSKVGEACDKQTFASVKGLADFFDKKAGKAAIFGAAEQNLAPGSDASADDPQEAQWLAFDVMEESGVANLTAVMMKGSGEPVDIKGVQEIDTDFLRYVPADMNVVAAAGLTPDIDWNAAGRLLGTVADRSTAGFIAAAIPYLKALDGTVAIAARIDEKTASDPKFFAMAHMSREKINDLMTQLGTLAAMSGAKTTPEGDNMVRMSIAGLPSDIYIGEVDGYFAMASYPLDGKAQNPFATAMEGHDAAAVVTADAGALPAAQFTDDATGIDVKFALDDSEATLRLSFPGAKKTPLAVIASALLR